MSKSCCFNSQRIKSINTKFFYQSGNTHNSSLISFRIESWLQFWQKFNLLFGLVSSVSCLFRPWGVGISISIKSLIRLFPYASCVPSSDCGWSVSVKTLLLIQCEVDYSDSISPLKVSPTTKLLVQLWNWRYLDIILILLVKNSVIFFVFLCN